MTPGWKGAGHSRHKARNLTGQQVSPPAPRVDHEHVVGMPSRSGLRDGTVLQLRFAAITRVNPHEQTQRGHRPLPTDPTAAPTARAMAGKACLAPDW